MAQIRFPVIDPVATGANITRLRLERGFTVRDLQQFFGFEEPQAIIDDIKTGIGRTNGKYVEICDRKEAIKYAISHGEVGDVIVLAGKGHEDYQEIKGVKYPMDERVLIAEVLEELKEEKQENGKI